MCVHVKSDTMYEIMLSVHVQSCSVAVCVWDQTLCMRQRRREIRERGREVREGERSGAPCVLGRDQALCACVSGIQHCLCVLCVGSGTFHVWLGGSGTLCVFV